MVALMLRQEELQLHRKDPVFMDRDGWLWLAPCWFKPWHGSQGKNQDGGECNVSRIYGMMMVYIMV